MNCQHSEQLIQRTLDRTITPGERAQMDRHLAGCARCRRAWDEYRALGRLTASWAQRQAAAAAATATGEDAFTAATLAQIRVPAPPRAVPWVAGAVVGIALALVGAQMYLFAPRLASVAPSALSVPVSPAAAMVTLGTLAETVRSLPGDSLRAWTVATESIPAATRLIWGAFAASLAANAVFVLRARYTGERRLVQ